MTTNQFLMKLQVPNRKEKGMAKLRESPQNIYVFTEDAIKSSDGHTSMNVFFLRKKFVYD